MKFREGDRAIVSPDFWRGETAYPSEMIAFSGQSVTIKNIGKVISDGSSYDNRYLYYIEEDGGKHLWDEDMLLSPYILCDAREEECIGASRTSPPTKERADGKADPVAHPAHYTYGKIEVIDFIQDKDLNFALGNAVKYIVRAGHKAEQGMSDEEKAIQDLEKARQYIDFEIEHRKGVRG